MKPYILYPDVNKERIAFITDDEVWTHDLKTGENKRILSNMGSLTNLRLSPDGKTVFIRVLRGTETPSNEIFSVPVEGGYPTQITFFGTRSLDLAGFSAEGNVIISTDALGPFGRASELYEFDPSTGNWNPLKVGPATTILYGNNLAIIGRNTFDIPNWKNYRGGLRGKVWASEGNQKFRKILDLNGNITSLALSGGRLFFTSDFNGIGQLYSCHISGNDIKAHTKMEEYYARNVRSDGKSLVFHAGGDLYYLRDSRAEPEKMEIELNLSGLQTNKRFVDPSHFMTDFNLSSNGDLLLFISRGHAFSVVAEKGPVMELGARSGGRIRSAAFIPGSGTIAGISDATGEDAIYLYNDAGMPLKRIDLDAGIIRKIQPSPDGKYLAVSNGRYELITVEIETGKKITLAKSEFGHIDDFSWHHTSRYLAYSFPENRSKAAIFIFDMKDKQSHRATTHGYRDFSPSFDPSGRYLYYLSQRELDPVYDKIVFELGYPMAAKPYCLTLSDKIPAPATGQMASGEYAEISFDDILGRSSSFPMDVADYQYLRAGKDGFFTLKFPVEGSMKYYLWSSAERSSGIVESYDLKKRKNSTVATGVSDIRLSMDMNRMLVKSQGSFYLVNLPQTDLVFPASADGNKAFRIDIQRIKLQVNPTEEWRQMFRETWVRMRESYWNPEKLGKFWEGIYRKYERLLPRITTRFALSDLIREMQGELGTSHAYEIGGETTTAQGYSVGRLGADFTWNGKAFVIARLYQGDRSSPAERSPLLLPGTGVREGDEIIAINGIPVDRMSPPNSALMNHAGEDVRIDLARNGEKFSITVPALLDDRNIRYRNWVEDRRAYVHDRTGGRVGYIHIPDMGPNGFNEFHRLLEEETGYEGLIVDVRFNGGGHVSQLLLEKLSRKRIGFDQPRRGPKVPYPEYSVEGPMVAVTNEFAGSDGDIFSHSWKLFGLGPLIGTRTWGGVVGINTDSTLVDGTIVTQPEFSFSFKDVGFGVENYGTDPTIEVDPTPEDYVEGKDPQLDRAIEEIMKSLKTKK